MTIFRVCRLLLEVHITLREVFQNFPLSYATIFILSIQVFYLYRLAELFLARLKHSRMFSLSV